MATVTEDRTERNPAAPGRMKGLVKRVVGPVVRHLDETTAAAEAAGLPLVDTRDQYQVSEAERKVALERLGKERGDRQPGEVEYVAGAVVVGSAVEKPPSRQSIEELKERYGVGAVSPAGVMTDPEGGLHRRHGEVPAYDGDAVLEVTGREVSSVPVTGGDEEAQPVYVRTEEAPANRDGDTTADVLDMTPHLAALDDTDPSEADAVADQPSEPEA